MIFEKLAESISPKKVRRGRYIYIYREREREREREGILYPRLTQFSVIINNDCTSSTTKRRSQNISITVVFFFLQ